MALAWSSAACAPSEPSTPTTIVAIGGSFALCLLERVDGRSGPRVLARDSRRRTAGSAQPRNLFDNRVWELRRRRFTGPFREVRRLGKRRDQQPMALDDRSGDICDLAPVVL